MKDTNWRKYLDLEIEKSLNELIYETKKYDFALKEAKDKPKAQLWLALALINSKLNLMLDKPSSSKKIPQKELLKILEQLEKY